MGLHEFEKDPSKAEGGVNVQKLVKGWSTQQTGLSKQVNPTENAMFIHGVQLL